MDRLTMFAIALDFSKIDANALLEKGIAFFFAVFLLVVFGRRLKGLENATHQQTFMFYECITWLGELIRHDKKLPPPTSPGVPHSHARRTDTPGNGAVTATTPTPIPPPPPFIPPKGGKS